MLRLHTRRDTEACEPGQIGVGDQLSVLDRPPRPRGGERVQRGRVRDVADRVDRAVETRSRRAGHEGQHLVGRVVECADIARFSGVMMRAGRRPRAERSIGDHLERSDPHEAAGSGELVAGSEPFADGALEVLGVDAEIHAKGVEPARHAALPRRSVPCHVEVDDPDHTSGGGIGGHGVDGGVTDRGVHIVEAPRDLEGGLFPNETALVGAHPLSLEGGGVHPDAVHIGIDEIGRHRTRRRVDQLQCRRVAPEPVAESGADAPSVGEHRSPRHDLRGIRCRGRDVEMLTLRDECPLHDVHVVIPQPRDDPRAAGVEDSADGTHGAGGGDVHDRAVGQEDIDRPQRGEAASRSAQPGCHDGVDTVPDGRHRSPLELTRRGWQTRARETV